MAIGGINELLEPVLGALSDPEPADRRAATDHRNESAWASGLRDLPPSNSFRLRRRGDDGSTSITPATKKRDGADRHQSGPWRAPLDPRRTKLTDRD